MEKGLEVVVMIYCRFLAQLYVSKHLRQQESRWLNRNLQTKTTTLLLLQSTSVAKILGVKLTRFGIPLIPCACSDFNRYMISHSSQQQDFQIERKCLIIVDR